MEIETFSGGERGVPPGACGLLAAAGRFRLGPVLQAARCLQYRGRSGAGVTLKGVYPGDHFVLHVMYRDRDRIRELEAALDARGIRFLDQEDLVPRKLYFEYDMPRMLRYVVREPGRDEMLDKERTEDPALFLERQIVHFNLSHRDHARIFSSGRDTGTFLTAFELADTIRVFDLEKYFETSLSACLVHLRWPTSAGLGLWWGPQPISLLDLSGIHNGHLASDRANAQALEQLDIPLLAGTDSEAIFLQVRHLVRKGFTLREMGWALNHRFPGEVALMPPAERERYESLLRDPILRNFRVSGPAMAIVLLGDRLFAFTDRDHLRQLALAGNDSLVLLGSETRAAVSAAYFLGEEVEATSPEAGRILAWSLEGGLKTLPPDWSSRGDVPQEMGA